jgi:hypothetical protein
MMHVPAEQPPVHCAGHAAAGGVGDSPHMNPQAPIPLHVWLVVHSRSGSWPGGMNAHVPDALPVFAVLHALHVPVQAFSQQTPSTHAFDAHCPFEVHAVPFAEPVVQWPLPSHVPPIPQGVPKAVGGFDGTPLVQTSSVHGLPSTGKFVSSGVGAFGFPLPSQRTTLQLPTVCAPLFAGVPEAKFMSPQAFVVHVALWQTVPWFEHSPGLLHATQFPAPSQTMPPVEHCVSRAAGGCSGVPFAHVARVQAFPVLAGVSLLSATDMVPPVPLQVSFWQSPGVCCAAGRAVPALV